MQKHFNSRFSSEFAVFRLNLRFSLGGKGAIATPLRWKINVDRSVNLIYWSNFAWKFHFHCHHNSTWHVPRAKERCGCVHLHMDLRGRSSNWHVPHHSNSGKGGRVSQTEKTTIKKLCFVGTKTFVGEDIPHKHTICQTLLNLFSPFEYLSDSFCWYRMGFVVFLFFRRGLSPSAKVIEVDWIKGSYSHAAGKKNQCGTLVLFLILVTFCKEIAFPLPL